jgi:hypothetical protein
MRPRKSRLGRANFINKPAWGTFPSCRFWESVRNKRLLQFHKSVDVILPTHLPQPQTPLVRERGYTSTDFLCSIIPSENMALTIGTQLGAHITGLDLLIGFFEEEVVGRVWYKRLMADIC